LIHRIRYNPAFLPEDALLAGFSVRQDELRELLGSIRRSGASANEHVLVVGARGSGKSTLLRVAGANVRRDPTLGAAWFPLFYAEESYEVASAAEFWLEALLHLGDATRDNRWATEWRDARVLRDDTRLEARALAALRRFHHESGKRLLLFVENFDMLVGQIPERDAAAIRKVLQGEPWVMLVASAVRRFPGVDEPDQPMFELFRRLQLDPLDAPAVDTAWHGLTGNHIGERRAEAVRILTGGNLRMLTLLAGFARGTTLGDLMGSLEALVDEHTDHFKDNIEALDGQNRRAFLAAAALWRPASVKELADEARLDARVVSTVVSRLVDQGRLEIVGKRGKNNLYQVAERLYNIYYLMRRRGGPDASVRALVDFILHYSEPTDLPCVVARIAEDGCAPGGAWRAEHLHAVAGTVEALVAQPAALAAVLGQLPGAFFEQEDRPAGVKRIERSPRGLAALLRRPDGEKYVAERGGDAGVCGEGGACHGFAGARGGLQAAGRGVDGRRDGELAGGTRGTPGTARGDGAACIDLPTWLATLATRAVSGRHRLGVGKRATGAGRGRSGRAASDDIRPSPGAPRRGSDLRRRRAGEDRWAACVRRARGTFLVRRIGALAFPDRPPRRHRARLRGRPFDCALGAHGARAARQARSGGCVPGRLRLGSGSLGLGRGRPP
jgi:hypothetical protein